jgi:hypothetical protein
VTSTFTRTRATMRRGELVLLMIVGAFVGYELVAHFTHYRYGRSLSEIIKEGEHSKILALGIGLRVLVAAGAVYLGLHLEGVAP